MARRGDRGQGECPSSKLGSYSSIEKLRGRWEGQEQEGKGKHDQGLCSLLELRKSLGELTPCFQTCPEGQQRCRSLFSLPTVRGLMKLAFKRPFGPFWGSYHRKTVWDSSEALCSFSLAPLGFPFSVHQSMLVSSSFLMTGEVIKKMG